MEQSLSERVRQLECELQETKELYLATSGHVAVLINQRQELAKKLTDSRKNTELRGAVLQAIEYMKIARGFLERGLDADSSGVA